MDSKIKVDLLVRGDLISKSFISCESGRTLLSCASQEFIDERCDISGAIVVDGDMRVGSIYGGLRNIVAMGNIMSNKKD